jgi:hypothetical protein
MISSCLHVSIMFGYPREGHLRSHWGLIQFGSSYLDGRGCPRHWNLRKFFFLSKLLLELLNQEDRVMRRHTSRVMKRNQILQCAMSPMHRRKGDMGDQEVLLHLIILISSFLHDQCALHHFLCFPPSFINLGTRFLLRERAITPHVTKILINLLKLQLRHQASTNQFIKVWNQNSKLGVQMWSFKYCLVWTDCLNQQILGNYCGRIRPCSQKRNCFPWLVLQVWQSTKIIEVGKYLFQWSKQG